MEGGVVEDFFENNYFIDSNEAIDLIEFFFKSELPNFKLKEKFDHGIYFGITYVNNEVEIRLGGGRGHFEHSFKIDGKDFPLRQFDKRMDKIITASKKNILFTLNVLKRFLKEST